jgi:glycosyltransferase involved in cell wall biosynthesis/tetratricopeptide (TPR) repeat protein
MTVPHGSYQPSHVRDANGSPLRVGMLTPWNQACGLATYAKFFVPHLTADVVAIFAENNCDVLGEDEPFVTRCWHRVSKGSQPNDYGVMEREIAQARLDILHINCHTAFFEQPSFSLMLGRIKSLGVKVVVNLHQLFTKRPEHEALLSVADRVIVHSLENRLEAIANGAREEAVKVVTHGVEVRDDLAAESRDSLRVKLGIDRKGPIITSFGFIQPHKGMEAVIEAVAHLQAQGIPARGIIVGEARTDQKSSAVYLKGLKDFVRVHELEDCVSFVSRYVTDREVGEYLAASDLVIMNYHSDYYEASGACSLALGAGAVVMSSLAPGMMAFGDAVWHMTGGYPPGLSAEILIRNPHLCEQIRMNARAYARENSWSNAGRCIQAVYDGLVESSEPKSAPIAEQVEVAASSEMTEITAPRVHAPMRILMQNRANTFVHRGGDTVVVERLSQGLTERGLDVTVDVTGTEDPSQYDLVHLFNFATADLTTDLGKRAQEAGVPFVVTTLYEDVPSFHHQSHAVAIKLLEYVARGQDRQWWAAHKLDLESIVPATRFGVDWLVDNATALFTNGSGESSAILGDFPQAKLVVEVPLGHEVGRMVGPELFEREYGVTDFVLCVGRIETRKNQLMLLKALEDSDLTVVLAGGGFSYQPEYEKAVRAFKRKGHTIILDRVTPEMLSSAYSACRIHVLPSWYELPGLVSLEAAAHGKNIVVTRTGTTGDYVGTKAFYCKPWDSDSINAAITAAFYAPVKEGLVEMAKSYTWDTAVDKTVSAYENIIKGSSAEVGDVPQATPVGGCYDMSVESKNIETLIEQGETAAREGDYVRAEALLREAEVADSTSTRVLKARGAVCLAQGRIAEAVSYFDRALKVTPHDPNLLTGLGMCVAVSGQPVEAMPVFERVLAQVPDHLVALHQLLECAYQLSAFNRAESAVRRYLSVKPQDTAIRFCLAGVLYKQGLWSAANSELSRVIAERPDHEAALELQEMIAKQTTPSAPVQAPVQVPIQMSQPAPVSAASEAVEASMKEAASNSNERSTGLAAEYFQQRDEKAADTASFVDGRMDEAEQCKREGKQGEAREALEKVRRTPGLTESQRERFSCIEAEFQVMDGELEIADEMYSNILSGNPRSVRAICGKGALAAERQEWTAAQEYFDKAVAIEPSYDVALAGLGLCAMVNKKEEKAFDLFQQAVKSNPENRRALLGVLQLGYPMKRYTEIEKALNSYLELHPGNIEMLYSFAGILFAQGKVEQAKSEVEKILIFEPKHTRALELRDLIRGEKPVGAGVRQ